MLFNKAHSRVRDFSSLDPLPMFLRVFFSASSHTSSHASKTFCYFLVLSSFSECLSSLFSSIRKISLSKSCYVSSRCSATSGSAAFCFFMTRPSAIRLLKWSLIFFHHGRAVYSGSTSLNSRDETNNSVERCQAHH